MLSARYYSAAGEAQGTRDLPEDPFDGVVHEAALHQVIKAYLANQRQGNASTKTRGEVSGGGRKIWRQKGTGRARQGSIRAPHWTGGGVVFGPRPRGYRQDIPKRLKALARRSALNARAAAEQVSIIERVELEAPKTKLAVALLGRMQMSGKVLILTAENRPEIYRAVRNLPNVSVLRYQEASAYDLLNAGELVIEESALAGAAVAAEEVSHA